MAVLLGAGVLWVTGCQGKPPDQATQNISNFQKMQTQMTDGRDQVAKTLASLDKYTQTPGLETYTVFVEDIQKCQMAAYTARSTADEMRQHGDAYFATWDAELAGMTNADLKAESSQQKDSVQQAYKQISAQAPSVRAAYDKFMTDCEDLKKFFDRDKSAAGVAAASNQIATTKADGAELQRQLNQSISNLNNVKTIFTEMKQGTSTGT